MYGAASGANHQLIQEITESYGDLSHYEINGYARGNNDTKMNEAIYKNYSVGSAIVELAKQGNFSAVETYINLAVKGFKYPNGGWTRGYIYYQLRDAALLITESYLLLRQNQLILK